LFIAPSAVVTRTAEGMVNNIPLLSEDAEQITFIKWLDSRGYKYSALPMSTYTKSWSVKARNTRMGVRPGVPDLVIIAEDKLMFVEMKRVRLGKVTTAQQGWIDALNKAGTPAKVCKGAVAAKAFVESVLDKGDMWEAA
jgi:hypothetical protein